MKVSVVRVGSGDARIEYDAEALAAPLDEREALLLDAQVMILSALADIETVASGLAETPEDE
jgi:hypothetical protein